MAKNWNFFRRAHPDPYTVSYIKAYMSLQEEVRRFCQNVDQHLKETGSSDNFTIQRTEMLKQRTIEIASRLARENS